MFDFSLESTEERILNMTLLELGIPLCHIIEIASEDEDKLPLFLELSADLTEVLPHLAGERA